jgi:hypothetical protein
MRQSTIVNREDDDAAHSMSNLGSDYHLEALRLLCQQGVGDPSSPQLTMAIDVETEITIARPRGDVADYACEPDNATAWYANIESAEWRTPRPLALGSRFAFVARFLGRRLAYVYEVKELVPGELLVMATGDGPLAMETTYTWADAGDGATVMLLRNRGGPSGFARFFAPLMASAMRRANRKDLARLKRILEQSD